MNREIKFRGQRIDNGKWIYGHLAPTMTKGGYAIMPVCYFMTRDLGEVDDNDETILSDYLALGGFIRVKPETIGQFTGLKDSNGNELYEGDVITYDLAEGMGEPALYNQTETIKYRRGDVGITLWYRNIQKKGNIFDHPYLVK